MNTDSVLKIVIGVGAGWAAFSIASAIYANSQKKKHESATIDTLVKTEAISSGSNFSGANGLFSRSSKPRVYKCTDVKGNTYYSMNPCKGVLKDTKQPCNSGDINEGTWHIGAGTKVCVPKNIS